MSTEQYRYIGDVPGELTSGRQLAPGEFVHLSETELAENQRLVDDGHLISANVEENQEPKATDAAAKKAKKEGISLNEVSGSGADGQITVDDVDRVIAEKEENA